MFKKKKKKVTHIQVLLLKDSLNVVLKCLYRGRKQHIFSRLLAILKIKNIFSLLPSPLTSLYTLLLLADNADLTEISL